MRKIFYIIATTVLGATGCKCQTGTFESMDPESFRTAIFDKSVIRLDVRTPEEFAEGHIAGAVNIDVQNPDFKKEFSKLDRKASVGVYCRSGRRSKLAAEFLAGMGFSGYELDGGYNAWVETKMTKPMLVSCLEIYDVEADTHKIIKEFPFSVEAPNWTPDGKNLIVNSRGKLYRIAADGSTELELIETAGSDFCNNDHVLTTDGRWIVFSGTSETQPEKRSLAFMVPIEGGVARQVTENGPSFLHGISPDSKTIAYCAFREERAGDIYVIPAEGGDEIRLTDADGLDDGPEYSSDGKHIWFNSVRTGRMQVWRMNPDGSEQTQMTFDTTVNAWFPHASPDLSKVVYVCYHEGDLEPGQHLAEKNVELRMMNYDGSDVRILTPLYGGQGTINVNSWSPDSKRFAYFSYRREEL